MYAHHLATLKTHAFNLKASGLSNKDVSIYVGRSIDTVRNWFNPAKAQNQAKRWKERWRSDPDFRQSERIRRREAAVKSPLAHVRGRLRTLNAAARHRGEPEIQATAEEVLARIDRQAGVCELCGDTRTKPLWIDHDHATGRFRGMLCPECNGKRIPAVERFGEAVRKYLSITQTDLTL